MTGMDQVRRLLAQDGAATTTGGDATRITPRPSAQQATTADYTPRHLTPGDGYWHPTPMEDGRRVAAYHAQNGAQRLTAAQARRRHHKNNRAARHD